MTQLCKTEASVREKILCAELERCRTRQLGSGEAALAGMMFIFQSDRRQIGVHAYTLIILNAC